MVGNENQRKQSASIYSQKFATREGGELKGKRGLDSRENPKWRHTLKEKEEDGGDDDDDEEEEEMNC